jgi:UDP-N-acetyl-D-mannosaminuronic acid dehydrogenase
MIKKNICVLGLGYIGLPTAALLASEGFLVNGVDTNEEIISKINEGKAHIYEPGLNELVRLTVKSNMFKAALIPSSSDIFIIAVPTPIHNYNNILTPNIDYVMMAVKSIIGIIRENNSIIIESTIPVGTTLKIELLLKKNGIDITKVNIAHCPERVLPGNILHELIYNDRVIGGINNRSSSVIEDFYKTFVKGNIYKTDSKTAEMCKLTENSFRDVNIAFANELSMICDKEEIDVLKLINLTNKHPRVNILQPGPGVGGHCIAIDPWFIISQHKLLSNLMKTARDVNLKKTQWVIDKILENCNSFKEKKGRKPIIALFGLTFKADIDDTRESPSLQIIETLNKKEFETVVIDPNIKLLENINLMDFTQAINIADIFVFLVKHKEFINLNISKQLINKDVLDFCGLLEMKS